PSTDLEIEEEDCTSWTGGISHEISDSEDDISAWEDEEKTTVDENECPDLEELAPHEVLESLRRECQFHADLDVLSKPTAYEKILANKPTSSWKKAEAQHCHGYNGRSDRTKRHNNKKLRDKEKKDAVTRKSNTAKTFRDFFTVHQTPHVDTDEEVNDSFHGYLSDLSDDEFHPMLSLLLLQKDKSFLFQSKKPE
ncbi:hypothetical protein BDQ17DRAFT_1334093, partial [Cyathus striatus]